MTIKLRSLLEENNILVPRNLDSREEQRKRIDFQRIQEYIKNGSKGRLDLRKTPLTKLPDSLVKIDGNLDLNSSNIEDLNNLEYIECDLWADNSKLKSLPKNKIKIGGSLSLTGCPIDNIDNVEYVGDDLWVNGTNINELPEGLGIGGCIIVWDTPLKKRFSDKTSFMKYLEERNIKVGGAIYL